MLDLVALLGRVGEPSVLGVLLKHAHSMLPFYQAFAKGGKQPSVLEVRSPTKRFGKLKEERCSTLWSDLQLLALCLHSGKCSNLSKVRLSWTSLRSQSS